MKRIAITACLSVFLLTAASPQAAHAGRRKITSAVITYRANKFKTKEGKKPTFVTWIEDKTGNHIVTICAWQTMAKLQQKNPKKSYFRNWRKTSMKCATAKTKVDAVSKATPSGGSSNKLVWDLHNADGSLVQPGIYVVKFESVVEGPENATFAQVTSLPFALGSRKSTYKKSYTKHYTGAKARKPAIYIRDLKLKLSK